MQSNLTERERSWVDARDKMIERLQNMRVGDVAIAVIGECEGMHDEEMAYAISVFAMVQNEELVRGLLQHASDHVNDKCGCTE